MTEFRFVYNDDEYRYRRIEDGSIIPERRDFSVGGWYEHECAPLPTLHRVGIDALMRIVPQLSQALPEKE